jgi:hypothetical protein
MRLRTTSLTLVTVNLHRASARTQLATVLWGPDGDLQVPSVAKVVVQSFHGTGCGLRTMSTLREKASSRRIPWH